MLCEWYCNKRLQTSAGWRLFTRGIVRKSKIYPHAVKLSYRNDNSSVKP